MGKESIDWKFIASLEGFETGGYVPADQKGGNESGVTVGGGVDLGQLAHSEVVDIPEDIKVKVAPYVGVTGKEARVLIDRCPLNLSYEEANFLTQWAKRRTISKLRSLWSQELGAEFCSETPRLQTVIASLAFQYGPNLPKAMPVFWGLVKKGFLGEMVNELRDFGDDYPSRRCKEAAYLEAGWKGDE